MYAENALDFKYPGIGANLFTMAMEGFLFFALTLLLEQDFFIHKIAPLLKPPVDEPVETSPHDVRPLTDKNVIVISTHYCIPTQTLFICLNTL